MNAIVLCTYQLQQPAGREKATCLASVGGHPILTYILGGLVRLGLTRIVLTVPKQTMHQIRIFSETHLPRDLVEYVPCPADLRPDSLQAVASALRSLEQTGLLIVNGNCIFGADLIGRIANPDTGVIAYHRSGNQCGQGNELLAIRDGRVGRETLPDSALGRALGVRYLPRAYLSAVRGALVELMASGAGRVPFHAVLQVLIERGYVFMGLDASDALFAEVNGPDDLSYATSVAMELQRREGLSKYPAKKNHACQLAFPLTTLPNHASVSLESDDLRTLQPGRE